MKSLCVLAVEPGRIDVAEREIREPRAGEILVRTLYSTVSPGTELRCLAGREPNAGSFPMITGYSLAGIVQRGGEGFAPGDLVFAPGSSVVPEGVSRSWGGHMGHAVLPAADALRLAPGTDARAASALAMLAIALHGVSRSQPFPGDRVLVAGLGLIGQLASMLYRAAGCRVAVCDPLPRRRALAIENGTYAYAAGAEWHAEARRDFPDGFDLLVDTTGVPSAVNDNLPLLRAKSWTRPEEASPKLVLLASYPGSLTLDYQETLFNKEAGIVTCRNYVRHDLERAARLIEDGTIDPRPLLAAVYPADQAMTAFDRLRTHPDEHPTAVLAYPGVGAGGEVIGCTR